MNATIIASLILGVKVDRHHFYTQKQYSTTVHSWWYKRILAETYKLWSHPRFYIEWGCRISCALNLEAWRTTLCYLDESSSSLNRVRVQTSGALMTNVSPDGFSTAPISRWSIFFDLRCIVRVPTMVCRGEVTKITIKILSCDNSAAPWSIRENQHPEFWSAGLRTEKFCLCRLY